MEGGILGLADRGDRLADSPRFARSGLLGSLEAVAAALAEPLPPDRIAAVASDAASTALDAATVVIAVPGQPHPLHRRGIPQESGTTLFATPVPLAGSAAGVLLVARPPELSAEEKSYLRVLGSLIGLALQRLRRRAPAGSHLRVGDLEIDLGAQRVVAGDRDARLTPSEIRLLLYLAEEPGRPRTRREILRHIWRTEHVADERACDAHVSNLRRKIERDPSRPQRLVTVRSVGYALRRM